MNISSCLLVNFCCAGGRTVTTDGGTFVIAHFTSLNFLVNVLVCNCCTRAFSFAPRLRMLTITKDVVPLTLKLVFVNNTNGDTVFPLRV